MTVFGYHGHKRLSGAGRSAQSASAEILSLVMPWCLFLVAVVLLVFLVGCSSSHLGKGLDIATIAAKSADFVSTNQAEARGGVEGNPLIGSSNLRQALMSIFGASVVIGSASLVESRNHKVLANVLRSAAIVGWSVASWHNGRVK